MQFSSISAEELLDLLDDTPRAFVLLYQDDALGAEALTALTSLSVQWPGVSVYAVRLSESSEAKLLQVSKLPQYRLYKAGSEIDCVVGVMRREELRTVEKKFSDL